MKKRILSGVFAVAMLGSLSSCGVDKVVDALDCASKIQSVGNDVSTASSTYSSEKTEENCKAYKAALEKAISDLESCDASVVTGYKNDLAQLKCGE